MDPVRTCVGCRRRAPRSALQRIVADPPTRSLVIDERAVMAGRGAWIHPTIECIDRAIARRAFGRALRSEAALDPAALGGLRERLAAQPSARASERTG
ncbi:YlxR family protein [Clavibacter michiganensis]|uniref:YlxR family protein n=1 Tax=Clavibacter michiganensis TaxID=28447 RepID=UPI0009B91074|nr:YlxR family protein [Clavibacter michiganensis]